MRKPWAVIAFMLCVLFIPPDARPDEKSQSLAEVARKERQRKAEQSKKAKVLTNDEVAGKTTASESQRKALMEFKLDEDVNRNQVEKKDSSKIAKAEPASKKDAGGRELYGNERRALQTLIDLIVAEEHCWGVQGHYVDLRQLTRNGCVGLGGNFTYTPRKGYESDLDQDYLYSIVLTGESCQIHANPVKNELAGFFWDGDQLYFNPRGAATVNDEELSVVVVHDMLD